MAVRVMLGLGLVVTGGCRKPPQKPAQEDPPRPGAPTTGSPFAVAICEGPTSATCEFRCSGTLIAPNLVLTARHCAYLPATTRVDCDSEVFRDEPMSPPQRYWVTSDPALKSPGGRWHRVSRFQVPRSPGGGVVKAACGADLLLLLLTDSLTPAEATPATPALQGGKGVFEGTAPVAAIGYGETAPDAGDFGTRRIRTSQVKACAPGSNSIAERELIMDATGCEGDSGAGIFEAREFERGNPLLVGVLSRGELAFPTCSHAIYERVDTWTRFLIDGAKMAADAGGYAPPAWSIVPNAEDGNGPLPFPKGSLGARCAAKEDCDSKRCASNNAGLDWVCSDACDQNAHPCPTGFECETADGNGSCFVVPPLVGAPPVAPTSKGCAHVARGGDTDVPALIAACVSLLWLRRRSVVHTRQST